MFLHSFLVIFTKIQATVVIIITCTLHPFACFDNKILSIKSHDVKNGSLLVFLLISLTQRRKRLLNTWCGYQLARNGDRCEDRMSIKAIHYQGGIYGGGDSSVVGS